MTDNDKRRPDRGIIGQAREIARRALSEAAKKISRRTGSAKEPEMVRVAPPPVAVSEQVEAPKQRIPGEEAPGSPVPGPEREPASPPPLAADMAPQAGSAAPIEGLLGSSPWRSTPPYPEEEKTSEAPLGEPIGILDIEEPPETYGVDEVTVLARDPFTLFAYWEVTGEGWNNARQMLGGNGTLVLRVYSAHPAPDGKPTTSTQDITLGWDHGRKYFPAPRPGACVTAAIGLLSVDGRFAPMAHSPRVRVPHAEPGPDGPVEWIEVVPAQSRGARLEPPQVRMRGPAREIPGAPGTATPGGERLPRWHEGAWEHFAGSRVPPRPGEGRLPTSGELPASPWRWLGSSSQ
ncbi:MAG: DUF4912 domain-containing protein [Deltaproteobacteria bacterium]|nr:DUF4912 domain-containing protein [Deltaproteobacteria bacterium]